MPDAGSASLDAQLSAAQRNPRMIQAALALRNGELGIAETLLRAKLREAPTDVAAIRMMAELAGRLGRYRDAEALLRRALELAPEFHAARANLATVLQRQSKFDEAHAQADELLREAPYDPNYLAIKAAALARTGGYEEAISAYESILNRFPDQPKLWVSYGHVLKTVGRQTDSIAAYRRAIQHAPTLGDAWWSLANLKTVKLGPADVSAMRVALEAAPSAEDCYHLHYALGKALEDAQDYAQSFVHYAEGARLRRIELPYDPEETSRHLERTRALMTREVFATRQSHGCPRPDPIFIVGLPRAGSTLIEQILSSHSRVEGTMELPDIAMIASGLSGRAGRARTAPVEQDGYLRALLALDAAGLRRLGERYLETTRIQRKTDRPLFVDKMPNNFAHIGMIQLILPNAKIIDARRHPMANCFSAFKQHFSRGQGFTYDLRELGRYYSDYVAVMNHYDDVLPGRVHRVFHEHLVADPAAEIRRLLEYCGLEFETSCLSFYDNPRPVRTASSEQVRRPISREALDQWRHFEPWLGELRAALGGLVDTYPA